MHQGQDKLSDEVQSDQGSWSAATKEDEGRFPTLPPWEYGGQDVGEMAKISRPNETFGLPATILKSDDHEGLDPTLVKAIEHQARKAQLNQILLPIHEELAAKIHKSQYARFQGSEDARLYMRHQALMRVLCENVECMMMPEDRDAPEAQEARELSYLWMLVKS